MFLIKDYDETLFFIKNEENNKEMRAIWTNSETITYPKHCCLTTLSETELDVEIFNKRSCGYATTCDDDFCTIYLNLGMNLELS